MTPQTYTARAGDTWASLAFALWSDETRMDALLDANPLLSSILVFAGGEIITIPAEPAKNLTAAMPPWRK